MLNKSNTYTERLSDIRSHDMTKQIRMKRSIIALKYKSLKRRFQSLALSHRVTTNLRESSLLRTRKITKQLSEDTNSVWDLSSFSVILHENRTRRMRTHAHARVIISNLDIFP